MKKIVLMFDTKMYHQKPTGYERVKITNVLKDAECEITISHLAESLSNGCTFKPAYLCGTREANWISQQLFALDFDDGTTIENELDRCKKLNISPCFGYTTFSHTNEHHKFRLIFCSDRIIMDYEEAINIQHTLMGLFEHCDAKCNNLSRFYFGGRNLICSDYDKEINTIDLIKRYSLTIKENKKYDKRKDSNSINEVASRLILDNSKNIEAIKTLNVGKMKDILFREDIGVTNIEDYLYISYPYYPQQICKSQTEMYNIIKNIDLRKFTGIYEMVNCILHDHDDDSPSAHIFVTYDGTQVYKCFGCNKTKNIISLVQAMAHCSKIDAIDYILAVYNIEYELPEKLLQQQQQMINSANYIESEEFTRTYPNLSKLIRTRKKHLIKLLKYFSKHINEDGLYLDGNLLFYGSYTTLMEVCGINHNKRITFSESIILFSLLNMITKVPVELIPEKLLNKAKAIAASCGHKKLTNFYTFNEYGISTLQESEKMAQKLIENNFSLKGLSREYVQRTFDKQLADKIFPQFKTENERGTSVKSNKATMDLSSKLLYIIKEKGFCYEKEIRGAGRTEVQWKISIQEILDSYGLKRVKLNKKLIAKYGINHKGGYPYIIIKAFV